MTPYELRCTGPKWSGLTVTEELYEPACREADQGKMSFDAREEYIVNWWLCNDRDVPLKEVEIRVFVEKLKVMYNDMRAAEFRLQDLMDDQQSEGMEVGRLHANVSELEKLLGHYAPLAKADQQSSAYSLMGLSAHLPSAFTVAKRADLATSSFDTGTKISDSAFNVPTRRIHHNGTPAKVKKSRSINDIIARVAKKPLPATGYMVVATPELSLSDAFTATMDKLESLNIEDKIEVLGFNANVYREPAKPAVPTSRVTTHGKVRRRAVPKPAFPQLPQSAVGQSGDPHPIFAVPKQNPMYARKPQGGAAKNTAAPKRKEKPDFFKRLVKSGKK